ncbi:hypothetical protein ACFPYJ_00080 [Paenibacillus solisilvae]|uniref:Uncharacterized protein n=1 Tax=Paenibacillus solisilvae TaxID=2486751 RepID=A0ABW0VRP8_9BACL
MFEAISRSDSIAIARSFGEQRADSLFLNKENKNFKRGLFNIKEARLIVWRQLPFEYGDIFQPKTPAIDQRFFYVAIEMQVYREDQYFLNGNNYMLISTAAQSGQRIIVRFQHLPLDRLIRDGYGFGTLDEKTYSQRRWAFLN